MPPRRIQNIKNKIRAEEEILDHDLKGAGLWEEGLSYNEKKQLFKLIADSKTSAEEEESRRQVIYSGAVPGAESTLKSVESIKNTPDDGDSDPEITYESPISIQRKNAVTSKANETPISSRQNDLSIHRREESTPLRPTNNEVLQKNKHLQSLLSNSSISITYSPNTSQNVSKSSENIVVSETEEESDEENCEPQIINDKGIVSQGQSKKVCSKQEEESCEIVPVVEMKDVNEGKINNISKADSDINKLKQISENGKNALLAINDTSKSESVIIEQKLNSISLETVDNVSVTKNGLSNKTDSSKATSLLSVKKSAVNSAKGPCIFVPNSHNCSDSEPLKVKRKFLSEKPSLTFFKASFETETNCVKRIYSLIADWQSALTEYQRSLLVPCKWGPPICVDRQITDSLLKGSYKTVSRVVDTLFESDNESSASDTRIINHSSDDDWILFNKKKKTKTFRKHYSRNAIKQTKKNYIEDNTEMDYFEPSVDEDILPDLDVKKVNSNNTVRELSPVASTSTAMGYRAPVIGQHEDYAKILSNKFSLNGKAIRKTFQISPDAKYESSAALERGSSSPEVFDSQTVSKQIEAKDQNVESKDKAKEKDSPDIEEFSETPKTSHVADQWVTQRGSTKRRRISNSSSMPPSKKSVSEKEDIVAHAASSSYSPLSSGSQSRKLENNVLDTPAKLPKGIEPKSTTVLEYTLPNENETSSEKDPKQVESEDVEPIKVEDVQKEASTTCGSNFTECPLCQLHFANQEIEAHASECNGPVDVAQQPPPQSQQQQHPQQQHPHPQPSTSARGTSTRSRMKASSSNDHPTMDVMYLETRSQASHSKN